MTSLTVVSPYGRRSATTRARALEWAEHLGIEVDLHDYAGSGVNRPSVLLRRPFGVYRAERDLRALTRERPERLLLLREATPFDRGRVAARLLGASQRGVYDLDDALFADVRRLPDPAAIFPKPDVARRAAAAADVVIAGNDVIADWATRLARDVVVVPTCVEPEDYRPKTEFALHDPPHLVWLGSPSQERQLRAVADDLAEVHRRTGARLVCISAGSADLGLPDGMVDRVDWDLGGFAGRLTDGDVGIAPLVDDAFSRGKCAYKVLQYGAAGLPVVGSPVGANRPAIARLDGVAVDRPGDWADAVTALLEEPAARRAERGTNARRAVVRHYSFTAWAAVWRNAVLGE